MNSFPDRFLAAVESVVNGPTLFSSLADKMLGRVAPKVVAAAETCSTSTQCGSCSGTDCGAYGGADCYKVTTCCEEPGINCTTTRSYIGRFCC